MPPESPRHERYDIRDKLGAGAMGVVYRAFDTARDEDIALKTISEVDPNRLFHLKQEFRAVADLHHPNLIELHELVVDESRAFFTMELVEGTDLLTWIRADAPPHLIQHGYETEATVNDKVGRSSSKDSDEPSKERPPPSPAPWHPSVAERLRRILPQLVSGLAALHDAGIIHRDVKPNNILVDDEERLVFLDFGVSVHRDWLEPEDMIGGTLVYMAPEQFMLGEIDPASDLYSLGVVLYEALTGVLPHVGRSQAEAFDKKISEPPRPILDVVPDIPEDLAALTMSLLSANPRLRPSAHELSSRLGGGPRALSHHRFIGRARELETLTHVHGLVTRTATPHLVHVVGPSGIGKTALVEQAASLFRAQGARLLRGRCLPHESTPFRALDALVDNLSRVLVAPEGEATEPLDIPPVLARLFPVLARASAPAALPDDVRSLPPADLRRQGASALRTLISTLCRRRRLVIWIDDMQWADRGSLPLLAELLRAPRAPAVTWVLTYRDGELLGPSAFEALAPAEVQHRLDLGPLPTEEAVALLDDHIPDDRGHVDTYRQALQDVGGSPFLLLQLADAIGGDPDASFAAGPLLATESFLGRRLRRLDDTEMRVMQTIALADQPVPRPVVARAAQCDDINPHLKALVRGRWVRTVLSGRGHALVPEHGRIRDAVLDELADESLREAHRRLADAFEQEPVPDAAAIARHRAEAGQREPAARWAVRAARDAMDALAFERAIGQYELAVSCDETLTASVPFLRERAAALRAQGLAEDAAHDLMRAATLDSSGDSFDDLRGAAELLIGSGRLDEGRAVLDRVLRRAGVTPPSSTGQTVLRLSWDRVQLWAGLKRLKLDGPDDSVETKMLLRRADACFIASSLLGFLNSLQSFGVHTQFARAAVASKDPGRIARAIALDRIYLGPLGRRPKGTDRFDALLDEVRPLVHDPDDRAFLTLMDGYNAFLWGHFDQAVGLLGTAASHYGREGYARWERSLAQNLRLASLEFCGRLAEVCEGYDELLDRFLTVDDRLAADTLRVAVGATVALARDELGHARLLLSACKERWQESLPPTFRLSVLTAEVRNDLYAGDPARALAKLDGADVVRQEMGAFQTVRIMLAWLTGLAAAQTRAADPSSKAARASLDEAARALAAEAGGWGSGLLPLLTAAQAVADRDRDRAFAALDDAEGLCASHGGMGLHVLGAARMRARLRDEDDSALLAQVSGSGVADAARYLRVITPG